MTPPVEPAARDAPAGSEDQTRLALVRHGETAWNARHLLQGSTDNALNAVGRDQAVATGDLLSSHRWDSLVSSPRSRAIETAHIIGDAIDLPLDRTYPLLAEREYGEGEGLTREEADARWPDGVPGEESFASVTDRGLRAIAAIADDHPGQDVVVVAHGTLIRAILTDLTATEVEHILNATVSVVARDDDGWHVHSINRRTLPDVL